MALSCLSLYRNCVDDFRSYGLLYIPNERFENIHMYLSALLAVLAGALIAYIYTRRFEKIRAEREVLSEFSNDLLEIWQLCQVYWLGNHLDRARALDLENTSHVLISKLQATTEYRPLIKSLMGINFTIYDELDSDLFIYATGGNFQTSAMEASPDTYKEISAVLVKIEHILRSLRSGAKTPYSLNQYF